MRSDQLSRTFAALADPTRRSILSRLAEGAATVNELAQPHQMTLPAVSRHLKVLEHAGLITRTRDAQWRPAHMHAAPIDEALAWMHAQKAIWEARLDRLDTHLQTTETDDA